MKSKAKYVDVKCDNCGNEFEKYISPSKPLKRFNYCNVKCKNSDSKWKLIGEANPNFGKSLVGENNPNFGKKWDADRKARQSEIIKSRVDEEYRLNCAKGMSGVIVSDETKKKRVDTRFKKYGKFGPDLVHSEESKMKIGKGSSEKFTDEFKAKQYETMVERGLWIRREAKDPYHFYRSLANWNCNVIEYKVIGYELAIKLGFYNYKNNKSGLVRDHRFSRYSGFQLDVFPEIIRHPFNCEFITLEENARKHHAKYIDSDSITIESLFEGIKTYNKEYKEQSICLEKIKQYENGLRYDANDYLKIY
jgi:hypothetical protein